AGDGGRGPAPAAGSPGAGGRRLRHGGLFRGAGGRWFGALGVGLGRVHGCSGAAGAAVAGAAGVEAGEAGLGAAAGGGVAGDVAAGGVAVVGGAAAGAAAAGGAAAGGAAAGAGRSRFSKRIKRINPSTVSSGR